MYWNKFQGKLTIAPTQKFLDHRVVWKITKKHGADGKQRKDTALKWKVALEQGYHAWCKFIVTKLKHIYIQGLAWINTTSTTHWTSVLTPQGVEVLVTTFPLPVRQEDLQTHEQDEDPRSFPSQKEFEANAKTLYNQAKTHHKFSRSSRSPTAQPSVTLTPTCAHIRNCGRGWRSLPSSAAVDQTNASKNASKPLSPRRTSPVRVRTIFRSYYCTHSLCSKTVDLFSTNGGSYSRCVEVYTYKDLFRKYNPRCVGIVSLITVFFSF